MDPGLNIETGITRLTISRHGNLDHDDEGTANAAVVPFATAVVVSLRRQTYCYRR